MVGGAGIQGGVIGGIGGMDSMFGGQPGASGLSGGSLFAVDTGFYTPPKTVCNEILWNIFQRILSFSISNSLRN